MCVCFKCLSTIFNAQPVTLDVVMITYPRGIICPFAVLRDFGFHLLNSRDFDTVNTFKYKEMHAPSESDR